jgi:hypothetical protein
MLQPQRARASGPATVFLLSPARCGSVRANLLTDPRGKSALAQQLRSEQGAELGEVFAFLSALYFRGKLAYARTFASPADSGVLVITPGEGLVSAAARIDVARMRAYGAVDVHHQNEQFAGPLLRDARALAERLGADARVVLLGSIASAKYVAPLQHVFGERLLFPAEFVGRGDMSRGGLLLRSAQDEIELEYMPVQGTVLRGRRPAKLPPRKRQRAAEP